LDALDGIVLKRFGLTVVSSLRDDSPQLIDGLSAEEVSLQLDAALGHAGRLKISRARDLTTFIRLSFLVGPNFCTYPPFSDFLASGKTDQGLVSTLFDIAAPADWERVATRGIVDRYRGSGPAGGNEKPNVAPAVSVVPLRAEHAEAMCRFASHPDVWRPAGLQPQLTHEHTRDLIVRDEASAQLRRFAIIGAESDFLGAMALRMQDDAAALSYWVRRDRWGQGIATMAARVLLSTPQARSMAPRVTARIAADNLPSIRVVEKTGFAEAMADGLAGVRHFVRQWDDN
jgi:RimJ/RimL family protein N-acetyltransferase